MAVADSVMRSCWATAPSADGLGSGPQIPGGIGQPLNNLVRLQGGLAHAAHKRLHPLLLCQGLITGLARLVGLLEGVLLHLLGFVDHDLEIGNHINQNVLEFSELRRERALGLHVQIASGNGPGKDIQPLERTGDGSHDPEEQEKNGHSHRNLDTDDAIFRHLCIVPGLGRAFLRDLGINRLKGSGGGDQGSGQVGDGFLVSDVTVEGVDVPLQGLVVGYFLPHTDRIH